MTLNDDQPIRVPTRVLRDIERVRDSGKVNMMFVNEVQAQASVMGCYALVVWIEDNRKWRGTMRAHPLMIGVSNGFEEDGT